MTTERAFLDELSIIVVTWNGDELLANCLQSLAECCGTVPEIVVVDNAGLGSTRAITERYVNVRYIPVANNVGFSGGNNIGLSGCTRKYVLLLNNDTIVHQQPFSTMIAYLKDHPDVAVVQGRMNLPLMGNVLDACGIMMSRCGILMERYAHMSSTLSVQGRYVLAAKGACLLFDRTVLDDVRVLFHNHFFNNYEDADFCHRVWLGGHKVVYLDTPAIDHLCNQSVRKIRRIDFEAQTLSNQLFSYLTLFGKRGLIMVLPLFVMFHLAIALRFLLVGQSQNCRIVLRAICRLWGRRHCLSYTRHMVQSNRKISDSELFEKVMPKHSLRYGWLWVRGRHEEFWRR